MKNVGIIGGGFVGGAMYENFEGIFDVHVWDIDEDRRTIETFESFVDWADIIFVCVPTPTKSLDGSCDTSIVESVVADIANANSDKLVVIKSTVPPGTTERMSKSHNMRILFNPEFLTEANSFKDFRYQQLIVIGCDNTEDGIILREMFSKFNKEVGNITANIVERTTKEAEMFKYLANCFLAMKVIFANEFKKLCDVSGVNYSNVADCAKLDSRLGKTHWNVPGPDGKFGFGGSCFPKDTSALIAYADEKDVMLWILNEAYYLNLQLREEESIR